MMNKTHMKKLYNEETIVVEIEWDTETGAEVRLDVTYSYWPEMKSARDRDGLQESPDDEPEIEITSVTINAPDYPRHGEDVQEDLSGKDMEKISKAVWKDVNKKLDE